MFGIPFSHLKCIWINQKLRFVAAAVLNLFHIEDVSRSSESIRLDYNHTMHVFLKLRVGVTQMVSYLRSREYDRWKEGGRKGRKKQERGGRGPVNCCNSGTKIIVTEARNRESTTLLLSKHN